MTDIAKGAADDFIAKWNGVSASELSTAQSFLCDLCRLLGVELPHPDAEQQYMFERPITFVHGDGSTSAGRIDLYKRGAFVLEAKKLKASTQAKGFDDAMLRARSQAEAYARSLPASDGRPPFVVVVDVGRVIELYSEFSRSGATYTPFPDPRSHRIALDDLRDEKIRDRLRNLWTDPLSLDPSRESARVTREIAAKLAQLAKSLERTHAPETVAQFLMRCLFTMFAEDVKLLPADSFLDLLKRYKDQPDVAMRMLHALWQNMDSGGFSSAIASDVLRFNGKLFKTPETLPLTREQIALLIEAAEKKWEHVEPAIFGTLLERALDPEERNKLGAHFTPRAYVERLVLPTVIEPLRTEWSDAKAAALVQLAEAEQTRNRGMELEGRKSQAERLKQYNIELRKVRDTLLGFHRRLCGVRILDPACGSGNFLYVTLEHLKRLEGEVLNTLEEFGLSRRGVSEQTGIDIETERAISVEAPTVDPHQLLGIELNPRAAAIAEVVLWIGYLQWHYRTHGDVNPPEPVIRDFRNIENRDAVLAYDKVEYVTDERGVPVTRWDGSAYKVSTITGENIPDETARVPLERYVNPCRAAWPQADFVVGNPPFIGASNIRRALGDGYVQALRGAWPEVPESSDFVMYWWHHAAVLTARGALQRFGFITTNSIRQTFNRRVVEAALLYKTGSSLLPPGEGARRTDEGPKKSKRSAPPEPSPGAARHPLPAGEGKSQPLSLVFAIPDHPWVDTADGAAVRIAMTVGDRDTHGGRLLEVIGERADAQGDAAVELRELRGVIHGDLSVGADVASALALQANSGLSCPEIKLHGAGFIVTPEEAAALGLRSTPGLERYIRPYRNGRDLTDHPRDVLVIDLFGLSAEDVRRKFPAVYQHVLERVKPERDQNNRASYRDNWWIHGEPRRELRKALAGLKRYIATVETAKHRVFQFLDADVAPDNKIIVVALEDSAMLGVLSSALHVTWAIAAGSTLEDRPVYVKTTCFEPFPFPTASDEQQARTRDLGEQLDAHRKRQQALHPDLTLTGMYNVLEKLRSGEPLTAKERTIHEHGLVSVLRQLHDELDAAVLDAYGWSDLLPLLRVAHGNEQSAVATARAGAQSRPPAEKPLDSGLRRNDEQNMVSRDDAKRAFDEAILERLVALNAERAAEEARGLVRWLRPEFQHPVATEAKPFQAEMDTGTEQDATLAVNPLVNKPRPWPKDAIEQVRAVADALAASPVPLSLDDIAAHFTARGAWKKRLPPLLEMLVALGRANETEGRYSAL